MNKAVDAGNAAGLCEILARHGAALFYDVREDRSDTEARGPLLYPSELLSRFLSRAQGEDLEIRRAIALLVAAGADPGVRYQNGNPAAFDASHPGAILALLEAGFAPDTLDSSGRNLLVFCLDRRRDSFREEAYIRALAGHGVAVNQAADDGTTALMYTRTGNELTLLLELGADICMRDKYGRSALHHWVYRSNAMAEIRLLLDAGLPVDERDQWGESPFLKAVGFGALNNAAFLLDQGADIHARNERGEGALDFYLEWYLENFIVLMRPDRIAGPLSFLRLLLEKGLDPSIAPEKGESPLGIILRKDPKAEGALAQILIDAAGPESSRAVRARHAKEKRDDFYKTISWYPGRTAFAVALPLVICGLSISMREGVYAGNPVANWMVGINSFLGTTSGLVMAGGLVGGVINLLFFSRSVHGLAGIGAGIGFAYMVGFGAIIGGIIGSIVSFVPGVLTAYRDNAFLYYLPSGISMMVSAVLLKSVFD